MISSHLCHSFEKVKFLSHLQVGILLILTHVVRIGVCGLGDWQQGDIRVAGTGDSGLQSFAGLGYQLYLTEIVL